MRKAFAFILIAAVMFSGCGKKSAAVVEGEDITEQMLEFGVDEKLAEHTMRGAQVNRENIKFAVLEDMISQKLMAEAAKAKGYSVPEEDIKRELAHYESALGAEKLRSMLSSRGLDMNYMQGLMAERLLAGRFFDEIVPAAVVKEEDIREAYKSMQSPIIKPERVEVRFVQFDTKEAAEKAVKKIQDSGGQFDKVAEALPKEEAIVSEYNWVEAGQFSPGIAKALSGLKEGAYGGPYDGKENFFLFRVKKRLKEGPATFEEAKDEILRNLLEQRRRSAAAQWISDRRQIAEITVDDKYSMPPGHPAVKQ